jgi:DHA1 family tetracycline resistance protein-like MFS transporter
LVIARLGERRTLLLGVGGAIIGFSAFGLAPTGTLLMASVPLISLMFFSGPSLQGLMARRVAPNEYGLLQGSNASLMGMAGIVGPLVFTQILAWFVVPRGGVSLPGAPFLVGASLFAVAWLVAWRFARLPATSAAAEPPLPSLDDTPAGV